MKQLYVSSTLKRQILDITEEVRGVVPKSGEGFAAIFVAHTTAAMTTADLDPGTDLDFLDFLQALTPELRWRHPHDPVHAPDHLIASLIGPSVIVPFEDGGLLLGVWQRIVLIELDGPRERAIVIATQE